MWDFFLWFLGQEPANIIYFRLIVLLVIIIMICVIRYLITVGKPAHKGAPLIAIASLIITFLSFYPIPKLINSYNNVILRVYTEAEECFEDNPQKAKELYSLISITDYQNTKEKIVLCDLQSAQKYVNNEEYDSVKGSPVCPCRHTPL